MFKPQDELESVPVKLSLKNPRVCTSVYYQLGNSEANAASAPAASASGWERKKDGSSGQVMPRKSVSRRLKISVGQWQLDLVLKGVGHSTKLNWPLVLTQKWFHTRSIGLQDSGPNTEYTGRF